jgi:aryl-alcohol dehydrogenase-like predicted oxidoreductase
VKYRQLGRTGVWVSEISLGTMTFGGKGHPVYGNIGALGQPEVERVVGTALDAGVNFVDTADVYADSESRNCSAGPSVTAGGRSCWPPSCWPRSDPAPTTRV